MSAPRATMRRRLVVAVGLVVTAAVAPACSTPTLDARGVESQIAQRLGSAYSPATVSGTRCPTGVRVRKGASFRCTSTVAGVAVGIDVLEVDGKGGLRITPDRAVVSTAKVVADLTYQLKKAYDQGGSAVPVAVDCGSRQVVVVAPGGSFDCTVTVSGVAQLEHVRVDDLAGHLSYRSAG